MSCGCDNTSPDQNTPCSDALKSNESVASALANLELSLFGAFTKTIVNGRAVWTAVCSPYDAGLSCYPRVDGEGLICYFLRVLDSIGFSFAGSWAIGTSYCKHSVVNYNNALYIAIVNTVGAQPDVSPASWVLFLSAIQGIPGPQGNPGTPGAGSAVNYGIRSTTTTVTQTDTDAVIRCSPAADMIVNLKAQASTLTGKWLTVKNVTGLHNVTITPNGAETINGAATYVLSLAGESVSIYSAGTGDWEIY